jgi:SSS family solute:Na+ symporter
MPLPLAAFGTIDWVVLGAYLGLMLAIGLVAAWRESRHASGTEEFFLGGRSMPTWALAISIVGSSLSVATFVGVPDRAFAGDCTYLVLYVGNFTAAFLVAFIFVPRLYRAGTVTIYGYLATRFGEPARVAVSLTFLFGRMLASGARLMLAAVPLCMLVLDRPANRITVEQMVLAICAIGFVGTFYTVFGGIRTVIWVDTIQFVLVVGAALLTIGLLLHRIHAPLGDVLAALHDAGKTRVLDVSTDPNKPFTLWTAIFGGLLVNMAAFGVDHDLAQRFLVAKSPSRGALSVIASQVIGMAVVSLFLLIGLLLYVFYTRPDLTGFTPHFPLPAAELSGATYQWFLIKELPPVLSGLAMAGLFAVSQGSMDSAINALASSAVADLYLPWRRRRARLAGTSAPRRGFGAPDADARPPDAPGAAKAEDSVAAPKWAVAAMGVVMSAFAVACAYAYDPKQKAFLDFALGVLNFAFSGMLAVFLTALLTRRGNNVSVVLALLTGVVAVALTQDSVLGPVTGALTGTPRTLAFTWAMPVATGLAFVVCVSGAPRAPREPVG